jgi:hypothetical protein
MIRATGLYLLDAMAGELLDDGGLDAFRRVYIGFGTGGIASTPLGDPATVECGCALGIV